MLRLLSPVRAAVDLAFVVRAAPAFAAAFEGKIVRRVRIAVRLCCAATCATDAENSSSAQRQTAIACRALTKRKARLDAHRERGDIKGKLDDCINFLLQKHCATS
jgi:hypothetical protein